MDRRIVRPDDCTHPAVTDADLLDAMDVWNHHGVDITPKCPDCRAYLYLHPDWDAEGDAETFVVHDDPLGAGDD